jgi:hypothetical protein
MSIDGQDLASGNSNYNPFVDIGLLIIVSLVTGMIASCTSSLSCLIFYGMVCSRMYMMYMTGAVGFFIHVREERAKASVGINEPLNRATGSTVAPPITSATSLSPS